VQWRKYNGECCDDQGSIPSYVQKDSESEIVILGRKTGRLPRGRDIAPEVPRDWFPTAEDEETEENISTTMKGSASEFPRASQEGLILSGAGEGRLRG